MNEAKAMSIANEYDAVILGESVAGLWLAKQLLNKGQKVLVVNTGTSGNRNFLPKIVAEDFKLLDFLKKRETEPLQILTPQFRFRAYANEEQFKAEYEFQFGKPFSLTDKPSNLLLRGLAYWVRGAETGPVFADEWSSLFSKFFETVYLDAPGGELTQRMLAELETLGATLVKPGNLQRIFIDRKAMVGIQLSHTSKMISVQKAFFNTHLDYLRSFLSEPLSIASHPLGWRFDLHFECSKDSLPIGLTDRMIYVEDEAPILEIFQERPGFFRLCTVLPYDESSLDRHEQRRLATRMLRVCEKLIPDLEYNLKKVSPDLRDPERTLNIDLPALYPFQELKRIPSSLLVYGSGGPSVNANPLLSLWITNEEAVPKESIWGGLQIAKTTL
jgi:hypothetical protein